MGTVLVLEPSLWHLGIFSTERGTGLFLLGFNKVLNNKSRNT